MTGRVSIIIPALNEAGLIEESLLCLQPYRQQGHEVIVVDGGSRDNTVDLARPLCDHVMSSPPGRARQMNAGASRASGDIYLFLHADTRLPGESCNRICQAIQNNHHWGRFDVTFSGRRPLLRLIAWSMNWRSRLTGIATGDQGIFVRSDVFNRCDGFADIPLMEDIRLSMTLKSVARPACLACPVTTSSRRWEKHGILRTVMLMWRLRLAFFLGANTSQLARLYQ